MKLWIDDVRPAPEGYRWYNSVNEAKRAIEKLEYLASMYDNSANYLPYAYFGDAEYAPEALRFRCMAECMELIRLRDMYAIELIDIDHDAGEYAADGGDYIKLLDWLEETGRNYPIRIHSQNVVGVQNMRAIIQRNGWAEVK